MRNLAIGAALTLAAFVAFGGQEGAEGWQDQGKPTAEHKRLEELAGKWTLSMDGVPKKGSAEFKTILGGRFLLEESKLPFGNSTFEWLGIYGYDANKKKYTAVWVDNFDTTTETAEADPNGEALSYRGKHFDPRKGKTAGFLWRLARHGDSHLTIEMFEVDDAGKENKVMTVNGERVK